MVVHPLMPSRALAVSAGDHIKGDQHRYKQTCIQLQSSYPRPGPRDESSVPRVRWWYYLV